MITLITEVAAAIIAAVALIIVATIETGNKRRRKTEETRQVRREKESRLSMEMMCAAIELSDVISIAVTGGRTNGNVEEAQRKAREAKQKYEDFIRDEAAHAVSKM